MEVCTQPACERVENCHFEKEVFMSKKKPYEE